MAEESGLVYELEGGEASEITPVAEDEIQEIPEDISGESQKIKLYKNL